MMQVDLGFKVPIILDNKHTVRTLVWISTLNDDCKVYDVAILKAKDLIEHPIGFLSSWLGFFKFKLPSFQSEARIERKWFMDIKIRASHEKTMVGGLPVVRFSITIEAWGRLYANVWLL